MASVSLGIRTSASEIRNAEQPVTRSSHTADTMQDNSASELSIACRDSSPAPAGPLQCSTAGLQQGARGKMGQKLPLKARMRSTGKCDGEGRPGRPFNSRGRGDTL